MLELLARTQPSARRLREDLVRERIAGRLPPLCPVQNRPLRQLDRL